MATNAILEGKGATVGLVTTEGFRQVLQIARSFVPGGLAGWIIWPKPEPLAALENTVEVPGRIASDGSVVRELDEDAARAQLRRLRDAGIEALAVSLINAFANDAHERRVGELAAEELPGIPVSLSSRVLPELREYERALTTVANGYVQPQVARYVANLGERAGQQVRGRAERGRGHPGPHGRPVEQVEQVLGRDVAGGGRGERAPPDPARAGVERGGAALDGRDRVGVAGVPGVVEVPAQRDAGGHVGGDVGQRPHPGRHPDADRVGQRHLVRLGLDAPGQHVGHPLRSDLALERAAERGGYGHRGPQPGRACPRRDPGPRHDRGRRC